MNYPNEIFVDTDLVGCPKNWEQRPFVGEYYIRGDYPELSLGEEAYNAYCQERGWKSVKGDALPKFYDQPVELRLAWQTAAKAVLRKAMSFFGKL